jgi:hypothetical protein
MAKRMTTTQVAGHGAQWRLLLRRRVPADAAAAVALTCLSGLAALAQESETPAGIIAAHIRTQGYACSQPISATRDRQASTPNEAVWVLRCQNARYRVRLVPDMGAQVTRLQ